METGEAYDEWALQYDTNQNKTRDLEAAALRDILSDIPFNHCLEIGCGTGKNTEWLVLGATHITAVDLSDKMLAKAKEKISATNVEFIRADINEPWAFGHRSYDLVTYSLVLEHIERLNHVFRETSNILSPGGHVYVGELHPFKQYTGTKARFDTAGGQQVVDCYNHHLSDFVKAATDNGLVPVTLNEYFDDDDRSTLPRILVLVFKKPDYLE